MTVTGNPAAEKKPRLPTAQESGRRLGYAGGGVGAYYAAKALLPAQVGGLEGEEVYAFGAMIIAAAGGWVVEHVIPALTRALAKVGE